jgi:small subunit ribosomal protein S17
MKTIKGIISSAKMQGTVTVIVHRHVFHPIYKKRFRRSKKFLADVGTFTDIREGDTVQITECRPLSKRKHFKISDVLIRVPRVSELKEEGGIETVLHREKKTSDKQKEVSSSQS